MKETPEPNTVTGLCPVGGRLHRAAAAVESDMIRLRLCAPPVVVDQVLREASERGETIREATDRYLRDG